MGDITIASSNEDHESSTGKCSEPLGPCLSQVTARAWIPNSGHSLCLMGALMCTLLMPLVYAHTLREHRSSTLMYRPAFVNASQKRFSSCITGRSVCSELRASKVDEILEDLKTLTLLETSELVKKIEETFGVSASMAVSAPAAAAGGPVGPAVVTQEELEEDEKPKKNSFEVVLLERPEEATVRMALFRALRKIIPDKPLTEVKAFIDHAPTVLKVVNKEEEGKEAVKIIEGAGAKAELR